MFTLDYEDLSNKVYKALKGMILKGELVSGQKLVQEDLAERLGVSRTPLQSAFSKLEKEMLVEIIPRRGAFVKKYTLRELLDIYDIRLRLEPLGAAEAAENADQEDIEVLQKRIQAFVDGVEAGDQGKIKENDYYIHMELMRMSRNNLLFSIISSFNIIVISNMKGLLKDSRVSIREHSNLMTAVKQRNIREAEKVMYEHISGSREALIRTIEESAQEPNRYQEG